MNNSDGRGRAFLAVVVALGLAGAWPVTTRAAEADQPEAGTADTQTSDDKPAVEGFAPDENGAVATAAASARNQAMCARLDKLMGQGLSYAERGKAVETRATLHCPPPSKATQAAEGARIGH